MAARSIAFDTFGRRFASGARSARAAAYAGEFAVALKIGADSLRAHKLRSFLTVLGVIIGVASVMLVGAAIEGMGTQAQNAFARVFNGNTYAVGQILTASSFAEALQKLRRNRAVQVEDMAYLIATTGDRIMYSPDVNQTLDVKRGSTICEKVTVHGVSAEMVAIQELPIADGRFFTVQEEITRQRVALIGEQVRRELFPNTAAVGGVVQIRGLEFTVIGVQPVQGRSFGRNLDKALYIPFSAARALQSSRRPLNVFARPRPESGLSVPDAVDLTRVALRTRFHTPPGEPDNFDSVTPEHFRQLLARVLQMVTAVVMPVTALSLVVGGIVIMNIMLVSVSERTREIGIRKALGARPADLRRQFLLEAVMLSGTGGAIGVAIGFVVTACVSAALGFTMTVTSGYVFAALFVSTLVGVLSGWYPAGRAARLDPIVALSQE